MLRLQAGIVVPPIPELEIRAVADAASAQDWERVLVDGFPVPELQPFRAGRLLPAGTPGPPGWQRWVGYLDGRPVATAAAYVCRSHVDVEFVATLEAVRGRGLGRALTATATATAPGLAAMLIASDAGRPVYERLGYRAILRFTLWAGHRPA